MVSHFLAGVKNLDYRALPLLMEMVSHLVYEFGDKYKTAINDTKITIQSAESGLNQLNADIIVRARHATSNAKTLVQHNNIQMRHAAINSSHQARTNVLHKYEESINATKHYLAQQRNLIKNSDTTIKTSASRLLANIKSDVKILVERVLLLDPSKILEKGFALVMSIDKKVLTNKSEALKHDKVSIRLKDGSIEANILEKYSEQ